MKDHPKIRADKDKFIVDFVKSINGTKIRIYKKGYLTIEEAERAIPILLEKKLEKIKKIKVKGKLKDFFEVYLEHRARKISPSTLIMVKGIYDSFFKLYDDDETSDVFSTHSVIHIYKEIISKSTLCEKSKNRAIGEFRLMVEYAAFMKLISSEEASDNKMILESIPITRKSKEKEYYTPNQLKKFLSAIQDEDDKDLFITFSYLGLRISEFIGLTWDCYDRINKSIEVKQQIIYLTEKRPILRDRLKTKESYRKCKLNNEVYERLENRRKKYGEVGYMFPKTHNTPDEPLPKTNLRKKMQRYMDKAKLPRISPHGFRHTKATMFMKVCRNMDEIKAAAKFMGHSVTMMMETYAHSDEKTIDTLIKRLEE